MDAMVVMMCFGSGALSYDYVCLHYARAGNVTLGIHSCL